jgi:hypothetical protein
VHFSFEVQALSSYKGHSGSGYGGQRRSGSSGWHRVGSNFNRAKRAFERRSKRSKFLDLVKMAEIAPDITAYIKAPNRFDYPGIDTVDPALVFEHKSNRAKAQDLAMLATRTKDVEVWFKHTGEFDLRGIDTPVKGKKAVKVSVKTKRFKVVKKSEAAKETEKEIEKVESKVAELKKTEPSDSPLVGGQRLPSHAEIVAKAQELYMKENARFGEETLPTEADLRSEESDYLRRAQLLLMTSEDTLAERKVMDYVEGLRAELQKIGFDVVPLAGFDASDLSF